VWIVRQVWIPKQCPTGISPTGDSESAAGPLTVSFPAQQPAVRQASNTAAVIVCGGQSKRMGRDKSQLLLGSCTLLQHTVDRIRNALPDAPLIVAAAASQTIPPLQNNVTVVRDESVGRGPLEGIRAAQNLLGASPRRVFLCGCDTPLLHPAIISLLIDACPPDSAVLPVDENREYPLCSVVSTAVLQQASSLIENGCRRLRDLFTAPTVRRMALAELRVVDRSLHSLLNVNTPEDYRLLLRLRETL